MRKLHIIPIIHSRHDLGSLDGPIQELKSQLLTDAANRSSQGTVIRFWQELRRAIESWELEFERVLLYQDALPYTGHPDQTIEHQVVRDLSVKGSPNHQLLEWLISQGATLIGTESTELLMKEYEAVRKSLAGGFLDLDIESNGESYPSSLLSQRDQFIANRIANTLEDSHVGILFIGLLHRVEYYLDESIAVEHPFGKPVACEQSSVTIKRCSGNT